MNSKKIAKLNDKFRHGFGEGRLTVTDNILKLRPETRTGILHKVECFEGIYGFNENNDPYGEHNYGMFEHNNDSYFWKIDYYDNQQKFKSPDPSNPDVTIRILTVGHISEY